MQSRRFNQIFAFGIESTAHKILYGMIDILNKTREGIAIELSDKINKYDELLQSLSIALTESLDYEKYQNATDEEKIAIRNSIANKLIDLSKEMTTSCTITSYDTVLLPSIFRPSKVSYKTLTGLQNNYTRTQNISDFTYSADSVSFPDEFLVSSNLTPCINEVLVSKHVDFCKNTNYLLHANKLYQQAKTMLKKEGDEAETATILFGRARDMYMLFQAAPNSSEQELKEKRLDKINIKMKKGI